MRYLIVILFVETFHLGYFSQTKHQLDTQSIKGKINQAREVLGFADKYFKAFTDEVNDLSTQKTEDSVLDAVFDTLFPKPDYDTFDRIVLLNEQNVTDDDEKFVKSKSNVSTMQ